MGTLRMGTLRAWSAVLLLWLLLVLPPLLLLALGAGMRILEYHRITSQTTSPGEIKLGIQVSGCWSVLYGIPWFPVKQRVMIISHIRSIDGRPML